MSKSQKEAAKDLGVKLKGNALEYRERAIYKHETPDDDHAKAKYYYDEYREVTE